MTDQRFYANDRGTLFTRGGLCFELLRGYSDRFPTTVFARVFREGLPVKAGEQFPLHDGLKVTAIPSWSGLSVMLAMPTLRHFFDMRMRGFSAAVLRVTGQAAIAAYPSCIRHGIPYVVHRIGEPRNQHELGTKLGHSLVARTIAEMALAWADIHEARMARSAVFNTAVSPTLAKRVYGTNFAIADTCIDSVDTTLGRPGMSQPARLLFVGRLVGVKNPHAVLRAGAILQRSCPVEIRIVGDGPLEAALRKEAEELGISNITAFAGHIYERDVLNAEYGKADVMILPSHSEGLPLVIIEAMAHGVPVLATDIGGIPDIVKDGVNGFLLKDASPEGIAARVTTLLNDQPFYHELSVSALKTACEYTVSCQAARLERVLGEAMRSGRVGVDGADGNGGLR